MSRLRTAGSVALFVLLMFGGGCRREQLGLPRIEVERVSPAGRNLAWVKNHLSLDPPAQSLWVRDLRTNEATRVLSLAEDQDWCRTIEWAADGSAVVFLVQDGRAVVYSPGNGRILVDRWLVPRDGYPTTSYAAGLSLTADGTALTYRECRRSSNECTDWITFDFDSTSGAV